MTRVRAHGAHFASNENDERTNSRYTQSGKRDSNPRPQPWQGCALPTELFPQIQGTGRLRAMTGRQRFPAQLDEASYCRGLGKFRSDGGEGNRTPDLSNAIQALSQLSYAPGLFSTAARRRRERRALWPGTAKYSQGYSGCQRKSDWRKCLRPVFCSAFLAHDRVGKATEN